MTQALGGSYTVVIHGNMARIEAHDADALGFEVPAAAAPTTAAASTVTDGGPLEEEQIYERLRTCYDPEIPVNIVDLGLIYDLQIGPIARRAIPGGSQDDVDRAGLRHGAGVATGCGDQGAEYSEG